MTSRAIPPAVRTARRRAIEAMLAGGLGWLMLRSRVRRWCRPVALARAAGRGCRVGGGLQRLSGPVTGLHDGVQGTRVGHLALEAGKLRIVRGNRLLQTVLQASSGRRVALLLSLDHERGIVELFVHRAERLLGEIQPMASEHRLCLGQPGPGEVEVEGELIRGAEGERSTRA